MFKHGSEYSTEGDISHDTQKTIAPWRIHSSRESYGVADIRSQINNQDAYPRGTAGSLGRNTITTNEVHGAQAMTDYLPNPANYPVSGPGLWLLVVHFRASRMCLKFPTFSESLTNQQIQLIDQGGFGHLVEASLNPGGELSYHYPEQQYLSIYLADHHYGLTPSPSTLQMSNTEVSPNMRKMSILY